MSRSFFLIWLGGLGSAAAVLFWLLHRGGGTGLPPIGGGSYSLDDFIYAWALVILTGLWATITFFLGLGLSDRVASRRAFILCGCGVLIMLLTFWLHGPDLS